MKIASQIIKVLTPLIAIIWLGGLLISMVKNIGQQNYSFFIDYAQISLTLFGFTLVGAVFENKRRINPIVKKLYHYSIVFLSSSISFFFLYSVSFLNFESGILKQVMSILILISMIFGFLGLTYGALFLLNTLLNYSKGLK